MPRDKTVFVVGAGASTEFGGSMPVGTQLATRIEIALNNEFSDQPNLRDGPIISSLRQRDHRHMTNDRKAANQVRRALHGKDSIDDLLEDWNDQPIMAEVSKIAIAKIILEAERHSELAEGITSNDALLMVAGRLRDTWLGLIVRYFKPGIRRRNIADAFQHIGFIVFNYDRCVERFLYAELQSHAGMSEEEAKTALGNIPIVHPHGQLGRLFDTTPIPFGFLSPHLWNVAQNIKTYSEEARDLSSLHRIKALLRDASKVVMLGFSYHPANMRLLCQLGLSDVPEIYGACLAPDPTRMDAARAMIGAPSHKLMLVDRKCSDYVQGLMGTILA